MDLMEKLADLSEDQLRELRARADHLLGPKAEELPESEVDLLHSAIQSVIRACPPLGSARKTRVWSTFLKHAPGVIAYGKEFQPQNRAELKRAFMLCVKTLATYLREVGTPIHYATIVRNLPKIEAVMDRAFPDYRAAGLLPMVFRMKRRV